jgi:hypothetical protein
VHVVRAVAPAVATRAETNVVYAAGLVQGVVLVTFPAASTIFTDPDEYDLSRSPYGAMFLPQVVTAIAGAQLGYGIAAFGAGPLQDGGVTLPAIFAIAAVGAGVIAVLSFVIARPSHQVTALHPRPA